MDLKVIETGNGGDVLYEGKDLSVITGFGNMPYFALFGGNVEQDTPALRLPEEQAFDWWGNSLLMNNDKSIQFNSLTERTLQNVALNSQGRLQIEQAVIKDLEFMKPFAGVSVAVSIVANDRVKIEIKLTEPQNKEEKQYIYIWDGTLKDLSA